jgi:hypothetical protein
VTENGRCFQLHAEASVFQVGLSFQRVVLTVESFDPVWMAAANSGSRWIPAAGTGVYAKSRPTSKASKAGLRMFVSDNSPPVWVVCPDDFKLEVPAMLSSPLVSLDWPAPVVFAMNEQHTVNDNPSNWDSRQFHYYDLPKRLEYLWTDNTGSAVCSFMVDAVNINWLTLEMGRSIAYSQHFDTVEVDSATTMVLLASDQHPGPFATVMISLQNSHRFQWVFEAPVGEVFVLRHAANEPTSFEMRVELDLNASAGSAFQMSDVVIDVAFGDDGFLNEQSSLPHSPRWFDYARDLTVLSPTTLTMMAGGVMPVESDEIYFRTVSITLTIPTGVSGTIPASPVQLGPRSIQVGFRRQTSTAADMLGLVNRDLEITCPGTQSVVIPSGSEVYTLTPDMLQPTTLVDILGSATLLPQPSLTYPAGTHDIELVAVDTANNTASCSFTIVVAPPRDVISGNGQQQGSEGGGLDSGAITGLATGLVMLILLLVLVAMMYVRHQTR